MTTAPPSPSPRRRWLSFSLRGMLLVVTAACIWLAIVSTRARRQEQAIAKVQELGGNLHFDYQRDHQGRSLPNGQPSAPAWLRRAVGEDYFRSVVSASLNRNSAMGGLKVRDDKLALLADLPDLVSLELSHNPVTDEGLVHLSGLRDLRTLYLSHTQVRGPGLAQVPRGLGHLSLSFTPLTNEGLANLRGMSELKSLRIDHTAITDRGLAYLSDMKSLEELSLAHTKVTDAGLVHLRALTSLKRLSVHLSDVTGAGVGLLERSLPNCKTYPLPEWLDATPQDIDLWPDDYRPSHDEVLAKIQGLGGADVKLGQNAVGEPTIISFQLFDNTISDKSLIRLLDEMPELELLNLRTVLVGDELAKELPQLKKLWFLSLADSRITDDGLRDVAQVQRLRDLDLSDTEISNDGLKHLESCQNLELIYANNSRVTIEGLARLKRAVPKLKNVPE